MTEKKEVAKPGRAVAPRPPRTAQSAVPTKLPICFVTASFVLACLFCVRTPGRRKIMRCLWLNTMDERLWFTNQFLVYYKSYRKSVVLLALRRLSRIFKIPLTAIEGSTELVSLFEQYKARQTRLQRMLSRITPQSDSANPLQIITQDYSDAEDDFENARKSSQADVPGLTPLGEHATVADYVRFMVEYDTMWQRVDRLRVTVALGVTEP